MVDHTYHQTASERGRRHLSDSGYKMHRHIDIHSDKAQDVKLIKKAFSEHDNQRHDGKPTKLRLRAGGKVPGGETKHRMDRRARGGMLVMDEPDDDMGNTNIPNHSARAAGGHVPKKGGNKTVINIIAGGDKPPMAPPRPMMPPPGPGGPPMPPHPPMAGPPPGLPPGAGLPPPGGGGLPPGALPPHPPMAGPGGPPPGMPPRARGGGLHRDIGGPMPMAQGMPPQGMMRPPMMQQPQARGGATKMRGC